MGRHPLKKNYSNSANAINRIAPTIKYQQASKLADKNSRTITKISQLMVSLKNVLLNLIIFINNKL